MNPLLAAIALHRAAQALVRQGMLDEASRAYALRNRLLCDARAFYGLRRIK